MLASSSALKCRHHRICLGQLFDLIEVQEPPRVCCLAVARRFRRLQAGVFRTSGLVKLHHRPGNGRGRLPRLIPLRRYRFRLIGEGCRPRPPEGYQAVRPRGWAQAFLSLPVIVAVDVRAYVLPAPCRTPADKRTGLGYLPVFAWAYMVDLLNGIGPVGRYHARKPDEAGLG